MPSSSLRVSATSLNSEYVRGGSLGSRPASSKASTLKKMTLFEAAWGMNCRASSTVYSARTAGKRDRKSTRLNSSHVAISYAVFCLKKKKKKAYGENRGA